MSRTNDTAWLQGAADALAVVMSERTGQKWIGTVKDTNSTHGCPSRPQTPPPTNADTAR